MAVNEHYPSLMPTLYPGLMATKLRPFGTLDAMWSAFQALSHNKTPAINGKICSSLPTSSSGVRLSAPSGPQPAGGGRGQSRTPSQSPALTQVTGVCTSGAAPLSLGAGACAPSAAPPQSRAAQ